MAEGTSSLGLLQESERGRPSTEGDAEEGQFLLLLFSSMIIQS